MEELRQAVRDEDWERLYEEGRTRITMRAEWSATEERCALLQMLARAGGARRVLEIGSFCGAGALALAEALPDDGEVLALELDEFSVALGKKFQAKSPAGGKIRTAVGRAAETLRGLVGREPPFDMVVVDADKEGARQYFDLVWATPGFLSEGAIVCVDMTPFKGQAPLRYAKFGFPYRWEAASGQEHIDALRAMVSESPDYTAYELGNLLIVRRSG